jgi:uncharacterized protein YbjT (DUF2867 family)
VGATGHLGKEMVKACRKQGDEVHAPVRPTTRGDPVKMKPLEAAGATIHEGDLNDYDSLVKACRTVDNVISAVDVMVCDEGSLVRAVEEAGVKRCIPSDFGVEPAVTAPGSCLVFDIKSAIHKSIKAARIPYTFVQRTASSRIGFSP